MKVSRIGVWSALVVLLITGIPFLIYMRNYLVRTSGRENSPGETVAITMAFGVMPILFVAGIAYLAGKSFEKKRKP